MFLFGGTFATPAMSAKAGVLSAIPLYSAQKGNGCPPGGETRPLFNGDTLSLFFSAFEARTRASSRAVHKSCNFIVTAMIPAGVRLRSVSVMSDLSESPLAASLPLSLMHWCTTNSLQPIIGSFSRDMTDHLKLPCRPVPV
jgi:hypothetical protein